MLFSATLVGLLMAYINAKLNGLEAKFDAKFEIVNQRFAGVYERFNLMEQRFDLIDRRFEAIDRRFDDMRDLWRAELHRVEEILDLRLKELERERR